MKPIVQIISAMLVLVLAFTGTAVPQGDSQTRELKNYLAGQKFLVTYRQGGSIYGTYFFLQVHLCRSGNYVTFGKSDKQSVVDDMVHQRRSWTDQGRWDVVGYGGQLGVQYLSSSGQSSFYPVRIGPNGLISTSNGMTVVRQGAAQCPR